MLACKRKKRKVQPRTGYDGPEREQSYRSTFSVTSTLDRCGWSTPLPGRFTPGKETRYPLNIRLGGSQGRSGLLRKISPSPGFDPRAVQLVASRQTTLSRPTLLVCKNCYSVGATRQQVPHHIYKTGCRTLVDAWIKTAKFMQRLMSKIFGTRWSRSLIFRSYVEDAKIETPHLPKLQAPSAQQIPSESRKLDPVYLQNFYPFNKHFFILMSKCQMGASSSLEATVRNTMIPFIPVFLEQSRLYSFSEP